MIKTITNFRMLCVAVLFVLSVPATSMAQWYDPATKPAWTIQVSEEQLTNPIDRPDDIQQKQREMSAQVSLSKKDSNLEATLTRIDIRILMGEAEIDPIGKEALEKVSYKIPWGNDHSAAKPFPTQDMDATLWSAAEPMAEFFTKVLQLCLPRLKAEDLQPGRFWSTTNEIQAALEGAPGVSSPVYIFFTVSDRQPCDAGTCVQVFQILHFSSFQRRPMGNSIIGVDLDGFGLVTTRIRIEDQSLLSSRGTLSMEIDTISHLSLGLPPVYAVHTTSQTDFEFYPSEAFSSRR